MPDSTDSFPYVKDGKKLKFEKDITTVQFVRNSIGTHDKRYK